MKPIRRPGRALLTAVSHHCSGLFAAATLALSASAFAAPAPEAGYPTKPVRWIVPFPPGGPVDAASRFVQPKISDALGRQFVIDNRSGANGIVGQESAATAAPDGYTILSISNGYTINASLYPKLPFNPHKAFDAIAPIASGPAVVVAHPSLPAQTMQELVALGKAKPGVYSFGTSGNGSAGHLGMEMLKRHTGMVITHVPYKGMAPALTDVLAGQVHLAVPTISSALPLVKGGRLRALAVTSAKRWPSLPDVPTISETVMPGYEATNWTGIVGPTGIPAPVAEKIREAVFRAVQMPDVMERLTSLGMEPMKMNRAEFATWIRNDLARWAEVVKASGAKPD